MATLTADKTRAGQHRTVANDTMEYRLIFLVCLPVLLIATLGERLGGTRTAQTDEPRKSFMAEALDATHRCTALAFTG